ncbi:MAG TPA: hypothetical protein VF278_14380, partial [Pirellulales bacterium]
MRFKHHVLLFVFAAAAIATAWGEGRAKTEKDSNANELTLAGDAPADWFERFAAMPNVRKLTVRRPDLKVFKVGRLDELRQLTSFCAEGFPLESPLAEAVAIKLAKVPGLRSVTFARTGLTDRGLARLKDSSITELTLKAEDFLTDDAFEHVAKMKALRT